VTLPVYRLSDNQIIGHEMLSRGPAGPLEKPDDIFRMSMELQMLVEVDLRMLDLAIEEAAKLPAAMRVHLNLFPSTLLQTPSQVVHELFKKDSSGRQFYIEIVEQERVADHDLMWEKLSELRKFGLMLAIDDVGFGASSLENLIVLEPDIVKIDRRFVTGAWSKNKPAKNLKRLIAVAQALGAELVAEGVDTPEDSDFLKSLGVDLGQGTLWGPLP
jgi:EAL domain-containing protein (putative c-di-GMP-specific phosphodiesterase class I)